MDSSYDFFYIAFTVRDMNKFDPLRRRLIDIAGPKGMDEYGAAWVQTGITSETLDRAEYSTYLEDCVERGITFMDGALTFEDWLLNGEPSAHDRGQDYERVPEG